MAAKDNRASGANEASPITLAERLFAANWNPNTGYTDERLAEQCQEAAEAFYRVRSSRRDAATTTN